MHRVFVIDKNKQALMPSQTPFKAAAAVATDPLILKITLYSNEEMVLYAS